jgi:hypothetical protein
VKIKLNKQHNLGASATVCEALLKKAGCDADGARRYGVAMARQMEARGLVIVQTHVIAPEPNSGPYRFGTVDDEHSVGAPE